MHLITAKLFRYRHLVYLWFVLSYFLLSFKFVSGEEGPPENGSSFPNPLSNIGSFPQLLDVIVNDIVIPIGVVVVVLGIIVSGFLYVKAQGKPEQLKTAHQAFLWTAIGAMIILGAWVISTAICNTMINITGNEDLCGDINRN